MSDGNEHDDRDPVKRGTRTDGVIGAIRQAIIDGTFSANERLIEADLADRFGVGRAVIRTALFELAKEGLVEREQNRGARVRSFTLDEAIEIAEVRRELEALSAAKAAERITDDERTELSELLEHMQEAVAGGDVLGYSDLNQVLHRRIREISGHATAGRIVGELRNQAVRHQFRIGLLPGRPSVSLREHDAIITAVCARDVNAAATAMREHLTSVIDALESVKEQRRSTADAEPLPL